MEQEAINLKPLLLAGGLSSRMGVPKHLLPLPDGKPLYNRVILQLAASFPGVEELYMSLRRTSELDVQVHDGLLADPPGSRVSDARCSILGAQRNIRVLYDAEAAVEDTHSLDSPSLGPAAGLLAAYRFDPTAHWVVVACDYPLVSVATFKQLRRDYVAPVTCFQNAEGFCEPLLGIWSPLALAKLEENATDGMLSPAKTVRQMGGRLIRPDEQAGERWLWNANTKGEWEKALEMMDNVKY